MMQESSLTVPRASPGLKNRRRCTRISAQNSASIHVGNGVLKAMGVLYDVSADGLAVQTDQPPEVGERVTVHVLTHGKIEAVTGRVVHVTITSEDRPVVGIHCNMLVLQGQELLAMALGLDARVS